jgi:aspartyl/asparaginyl beta-hydroxylase (cupin superfamily)
VLIYILNREIHYHTRLERSKLELRMRYDWTNGAVFDAIDFLRENEINHRNIASFLKQNGHYATESELTAIIRRLDLDAD